MNKQTDFSLLIKLIKVAQGNRSLNQFALHCGISAGHLSRILNGKFLTPPTPKLIEKIAQHAYNNITYDQMMKAAGYYALGTEENEIVKEAISREYELYTNNNEYNLVKKIMLVPELKLLLDELIDAPHFKIKQLYDIWNIVKQ